MKDPWYVTEDGSEIYVPRSTAFNAARKIAADAAQELGDQWSRTRYAGKLTTVLHDCEEWLWEDCHSCPEVPAWVFEVYEGTYRR